MTPTWKNAKAVAVFAIVVDKCRVGRRLSDAVITTIERDGYEGYRICRFAANVSVEFVEHQFTNYIKVVDGDVAEPKGTKSFASDDYVGAAEHVMRFLGI